MSVFGKGLSKVALAQLREVIREEVRSEIDRAINPNFIDLVTRGQAEMTKIFDAVLQFQDELDAVRLSLKILESEAAKRP